MHSFSIGDFVAHVNGDLNWGTGKVIDLSDGKYTVYFENAGKKMMLAQFLVPSEGSSSEVLRNVDKESDFSKSRARNDILDGFLDLFPEGFDCPEYLQGERDYKLKASEFIKEKFSVAAMRSMLDKEDYDSLCTMARQALGKTNLVYPNEIMDLNDGLKKAGVSLKKEFCLALYDLLHGDGPLNERYESFFKALYSLDAAKWTTATYYAFLYDPTRYVFMKPTVTQNAAKAFNFPFRYTTELKWDTYKQLNDFYVYLKQYLLENTELAPRDMIDVQGFMWCADPKSYGYESKQDVLRRRRERTMGFEK